MNQSTHSSPPIHYVMWMSKPGGAELSVRHYAEAFADQRNLFIYSLRDAENEVCDSAAVQFRKGHDRQWPCYKAYFRYCRQHRGDQFHLLSTGPVILLLTLLAGVRRPLYHIHGTIYWKKWYQKYYLKTAWILSSLFRVDFVANSEYSKAVFRRDVLPLKMQVIYNGFDLAPFMNNRHKRQTLRKMAYAGRLQPGKNVDMVIRLFEEIAGEHSELELHIAGDGALRPTLEEQARSGPYADRIHFHGWVQDVAEFYASVDLLVFLSAYESFGNVLAEALLTGLPVLTTDIPAFLEIFNGDDTFVLGGPDDYDQLRTAFLSALTHYSALAEKAYILSNSLPEKFDIESHVAEIKAIYETREPSRHLLPFGRSKALL